MGLLQLTAAEVKAIVDRSPRLPSVRMVVDAVRRNPNALPDLAEARQRLRAAAMATAALRQELLAAFTTTQLPREIWSAWAAFGRPRSADADRLDFPLRRLFETRDAPAVEVCRRQVDSATTPLDETGMQEPAERRAAFWGAAFDAEAWLAERAADVDCDAALRRRQINRLVNRLGWAVIGIIRAGVGSRPESPAAADNDTLVPIALAAQMLGVSKNAAVKCARKKGFDELVGGRVHIRRSLIARLYEKRGRVG